MNKEQRQQFEKEIGGRSADELNALNEELEAQRAAIRDKQRVLVEVRARKLRADRVAEVESSAQHVRAGVVDVKGSAVR